MTVKESKEITILLDAQNELSLQTYKGLGDEIDGIALEYELGAGPQGLTFVSRQTLFIQKTKWRELAEKVQELLPREPEPFIPLDYPEIPGGRLKVIIENWRGDGNSREKILPLGDRDINCKTRINHCLVALREALLDYFYGRLLSTGKLGVDVHEFDFSVIILERKKKDGDL